MDDMILKYYVVYLLLYEMPGRSQWTRKGKHRDIEKKYLSWKFIFLRQ